MACSSCTADTTNGLNLCETCRAALLVYLEWIPVHFRNLARLKTAPRLNASMPRWSPPRATDDEPVKRRDGGLIEIGNALATAHADLTGWARTLQVERPQLAAELEPMLTEHESPFVTAFCDLLTRHVMTLLTLPWTGDLIHGLKRIEKRLGRLTDEWVPGWYAGKCPRCQKDRHVEPGVTWITCSGCGATTPARDSIDVILNEAADWVARPKGTTKNPGLAEVIVALTRESSIDLVAKRIRTWSERGQLMACVSVDRDGDPTRKRFRLGEVMNRLKESA